MLTIQQLAMNSIAKAKENNIDLTTDIGLIRLIADSLKQYQEQQNNRYKNVANKLLESIKYLNNNSIDSINTIDNGTYEFSPLYPKFNIDVHNNNWCNVCNDTDINNKKAIDYLSFSLESEIKNTLEIAYNPSLSSDRMIANKTKARELFTKHNIKVIELLPNTKYNAMSSDYVAHDSITVAFIEELFKL